MTKLYPKGTIRRIVKAHEPNHKLSKSADVLVRFLPAYLSQPFLPFPLPPFFADSPTLLLVFRGLTRVVGLFGLRTLYKGVDERG